jgi:hypothetical protein
MPETGFAVRRLMHTHRLDQIIKKELSVLETAQSTADPAQGMRLRIRDLIDLARLSALQQDQALALLDAPHRRTQRLTAPNPQYNDSWSPPRMHHAGKAPVLLLRPTKPSMHPLWPFALKSPGAFLREKGYSAAAIQRRAVKQLLFDLAEA